jgi:hypothetical protein
MMTRLSLDKKRKHILIVAAVALFFGLVYRFYPSVQSLLFPKAEIELKEAKILKYQKELTADGGLDVLLNSLKESLKEAEKGLLTGKTRSLAAVQIQEILQEITEKSGVVIRSLNVLNPEELDKEGYLSIPVEFYLFATISQFKEVLYRIGISQKYLAVKQLRIDYTKSGPEDTIRCHMTVAGYMQGMNG